MFDRCRVEIVMKNATIFIIALFFVIPTQAQETRKTLRSYLFSDTITIDGSSRIKADAFYDSLQKRKYKSWISRTVTQLLIVNRNTRDASIPNTEMEIAQKYFRQFSGRTISDVRVIQANVFEQRNSENESWAERFVNSLHVLTKERQLRQNFLFKEGDKIDAYEMAINERLVRNLPYISTAFFVVVPDKGDSTKVSVNVFARDNWSISGDANIGSTSSGRVYDKNFLGLANQLTLKYYYKQGHQSNGFEGTYTIDNMLGTFADVEVSAGVGYSDNTLMIKANRPFILPSDHIFGLVAGYKQNNAGMATFDTVMIVNKQQYAAWYGYSLNIDRNQGTNIYFTVGADRVIFDKRPKVDSNLNPYYHNYGSILTSIGLARQNYFQGNMIYGYGRTEDVPYGYRFDATGGVHWSEFYGRRYYASGYLSWAEMMNFGYLNAKVGAATFINELGIKSQGMATADLRYFSPLWHVKKLYLRQFLNVSAIWGFNRLKGDMEELSYTENANVRGIKTGLESLGYNRLTIGAENVFFTPIFFYHFRFAFNVWGDVGWLGYDNRMFKNPVASTVGFGVRIRNERLLFNSIALRLGFAIRQPEHARFSSFQSTIEHTLSLEGFAPTTPRIMPYR